MYSSSMHVLSAHLFWTSDLLVDAPAGVTQEEGYTGFLHLPFAVRALIFIASRIQPSLSLVHGDLLTRWDVSSIPANGIFLTKK